MAVSAIEESHEIGNVNSSQYTFVYHFEMYLSVSVSVYLFYFSSSVK